MIPEIAPSRLSRSCLSKKKAVLPLARTALRSKSGPILRAHEAIPGFLRLIILESGLAHLARSEAERIDGES